MRTGARHADRRISHAAHLPGCHRLRDGRGGGSPGAEDDPAKVAPGGHQVDGLSDLSEWDVDVLQVQPAGGEQVP
jgi:hypothetical protein